jgi:hypothetical protein
VGFPARVVKDHITKDHTIYIKQDKNRDHMYGGWEECSESEAEYDYFSFVGEPHYVLTLIANNHDITHKDWEGFVIGYGSPLPSSRWFIKDSELHRIEKTISATDVILYSHWDYKHAEYFEILNSL